MKMWSGRFRQPLDPQFEQWQRSFPFDKKLLAYELAASAAHAQALRIAGVLTTEEWHSVQDGLKQIEQKAAGEADKAAEAKQSYANALRFTPSSKTFAEALQRVNSQR